MSLTWFYHVSQQVSTHVHGQGIVPIEFGQQPQRAMDVGSATSDVEAVGLDLGVQETRPKQLKSGGTERLPGKSRVQKILKADKVSSPQYLSLST